MALHDLDSFERLNRANQYSAACARAFARNIQHEVHAVIEIHIHMPMPEKKRPVPPRGPSKMVPCGISWRIAFRFHNPSAEPPLRQIANHDLSDEKSRKRQRVARKLFPGNAAQFDGKAVHGLQRICVGRLVVKKPRQFRVVDHHRGVRLDCIKIFLLEGVARF